MRKLVKFWSMIGGQQVVELFAGVTVPSFVRDAPVALAQAANIVINAALGSEFIITLTTNAVHTINAPINPPAAGQSQQITVTLVNTSGGAAGAATFAGGAGGFRLAGAWVQAANNNMRSGTFRFDVAGNRWVEIARNAADVPV